MAVRNAGCAAIDGLGTGAEASGVGFGLGFGVAVAGVARGVGFGVALGVGLGVGLGVATGFGVGAGVVPGFGLCDAFAGATSAEMPAVPSSGVVASTDAPKPAVSATTTASDASDFRARFDIDPTCRTMPFAARLVGYPSVPLPAIPNRAVRTPDSGRVGAMGEATATTPPTGRLMRLLLARGGAATGEPTMVLQHREALIWTLGKAAALEQLVMCQYLYAAFGLKDREDDGLTAPQLDATRRWRRELIHIAEQEMLHLALVQNLLTSVGAAPTFGRPNFPLPPHAYPAGIRMELLPFGEQSLRHFIYLERPEGLDMADQDELAAIEKAAPLPVADEDDIGPRLQDFETIGGLYRAIEVGFDRLAERLGEQRLFLGPPGAQATSGRFWLSGFVPVTDLASAHAAIDVIVEQGEGARGDWREAHFGRLVAVLDEFLDLRDADPSFEPSRPVLTAIVREREDGLPMPLISDPFTSRAVDLLNAVYEVLLQVLARSFAHTEETEDELDVLAATAIGLMRDVVKPLGGLVTRLPVGPEHPGRTAGPTFELFYGSDLLLPHRDAAWLVMEERMRLLAELGGHCKAVCSPMHLPVLSRITDSLVVLADQLAEAH